VYDITVDDLRLRDAIDRPPAERAAHFDRLRKTYPMRREYRYTTLMFSGVDAETRAAAETLQFRIHSSR
jgi:hypothetical protein